MKLEEIEILAVTVKAAPGTVLGAAILEAIQLASTEKRTVMLTHNETVYEIDPKILIQCVIGTEAK